MSHPVIGVPPKNADSVNPMHGQISLARCTGGAEVQGVEQRGADARPLAPITKRGGNFCNFVFRNCWASVSDELQHVGARDQTPTITVSIGGCSAAHGRRAGSAKAAAVELAAQLADMSGRVSADITESARPLSQRTRRLRSARCWCHRFGLLRTATAGIFLAGTAKRLFMLNSRNSHRCLELQPNRGCRPYNLGV